MISGLDSGLVGRGRRTEWSRVTDAGVSPSSPLAQQAIALRGKVAHLNDLPVAPEPAQTNQPPPPALLGPPGGRAWVYWSQNVSLDRPEALARTRLPGRSSPAVRH